MFSALLIFTGVWALLLLAFAACVYAGSTSDLENDFLTGSTVFLGILFAAMSIGYCNFIHKYVNQQVIAIQQQSVVSHEPLSEKD